MTHNEMFYSLFMQLFCLFLFGHVVGPLKVSSVKAGMKAELQRLCTLNHSDCMAPCCSQDTKNLVISSQVRSTK